MTDENKRHYLYSYRRCPYAMRARMALFYAGIAVDIENIDFKNKPEEMLDISPKGTVPVLKLDDGTVIDESLDIMEWALSENDPDGWLDADDIMLKTLITHNDGPFKKALNTYKYADRHPEEEASTAREEGLDFLKQLDHRLSQTKYLCGDHITQADIAIFPFVRQFANVDHEWFEEQSLKNLKKWLNERLESALFKTIMEKDRETLN